MSHLRACVRRMRTVLKENNIPICKQAPALKKFCNIIGYPKPDNVNINNWVLQLYREGKLSHIKPYTNPRKKLKPKDVKKPKDFYQTEKWLTLKKKVLRTYGCYCMKCFVKRTEIHVDHIRPRSKRPDLELNFNNLQCLCRKCNYEKMNYNEIDYRPLDIQLAYPLPV